MEKDFFSAHEHDQVESKASRFGGKADGLKVLADLGYSVPYYISLGESEDVQSVVSQLDSTKFWAVRSSANVEDRVDASFAGMFKSVIGVRTHEIMDAVRAVRNSKTSESVTYYAQTVGINPQSIEMNVVIQEFDEPIISGVWIGSGEGSGVLEWLNGRGEKLVGGYETPISEIYAEGVKDNDSPLSVNGTSVANICIAIQNKVGYSADIEFCITDSGLKLLQLRKAVVDMVLPTSVNESLEVSDVIAKGEGSSLHVAEGVSHRKDLHGSVGWKEDAILIAKATSPEDMLMIMMSNGVVTELGGRLSHAAVVCRELGKACIVGVEIDKIQHGSRVEVNGFSGLIKTVNS